MDLSCLSNSFSLTEDGLTKLDPVTRKGRSSLRRTQSSDGYTSDFECGSRKDQESRSLSLTLVYNRKDPEVEGLTSRTLKSRRY